jgi:alpha-tubulin suppressor-like RCC1 family protein
MTASLPTHHRPPPNGCTTMQIRHLLVLMMAAATAGSCTGDSTGPEIPRTHLPVPVGGNLFFASIAASANHTCGLTTTRETYCWGAVGESYLLLPTPIADTARFAQVTAHCGLRDTGDVRCWNFPSLQPRPVPGSFLRFTMISSGPARACGLTAEGSVHCWSHQEVTTPQLISGLPPLVTIDVGRGAFTVCGLTAEGLAHCMNLAGRREPVGDGRTFSELSNGGFHACGLSNGTGFCWGSNEWGQLGTGSTAVQPAPVVGQQPFVALAVGEDHACALTAVGAAWCWGLNDLGQLGSLGAETCTAQVPWVGTVTAPCSRSPRAVQTDLRFASLASGRVHTCGLTAAGEAYCWGARALLGDGRRR